MRKENDEKAEHIAGMERKRNAEALMHLMKGKATGAQMDAKAKTARKKKTDPKKTTAKKGSTTKARKKH